MYEMKLNNGEILELDEKAYQDFRAAIGTGPRFIDFTLGGSAWVVSKDHIVSVHQKQ